MLKLAVKSTSKPKILPLGALVILLFAMNTSPAAAFTNNRYLAYGKKVAAPAPGKAPGFGQLHSQRCVYHRFGNRHYKQMVAEGLLKGQKGDKGDPGEPGAALPSSQPADGVAAPAPIVYNSNIPGNIAGFTELSGGDVAAQTSLTVNSGAPWK